MKIVHCSDLHLGKRLSGTKDYVTKRYMDFLLFILDDDTKNIEKIEKSKQIIKLSKWLYENWDQEIKEYFEKIQITNKLETKYKFKYDL